MNIRCLNILKYSNLQTKCRLKRLKAATKGAKQIVEENKITLSFYQNMIIGALGIYFYCHDVVF